MSVRQVGTVGDKLDEWYLAFLEQEGVYPYKQDLTGEEPRMSTRKRSRTDGAAKPAAKKSRKTAIRRYARASIFPPETKYFDTSFSQTIANGADWTGSEVPCTNYIQSDGTTVGSYTDSALIPSAVGSGYGQVIGSKYLLKAIRVRGEIAPAVVAAAAAALTPPVVRVVMVMDTMPQGAQAQGEDIFSDMGTNTQCLYSFLAMGAGKGGRFRILADDYVALDSPYAFNDAAATGALSAARKTFEMSHSFKKPIEVQIKASASTPATSSLSNCNIFLLAHTESTWANTINGVARAYYVE